MKLYSENKEYKLYHGNMLDMLDDIAENSIDSIVTDPPYELGFMGKDWDRSGIAYQKETWEKCLRVLKPGGHMVVFGGSRTHHRVACAIEDVGFEIRDCIMYLYGCYSADTQVLTDAGWKYFYNLDKTERVLQWNKDTNVLSWVKPLEYFEYDIDDDMVRLENRHTEQLLTKNHKVVCDIRATHEKYKSSFDFVDAGSIRKSDLIKLPLASYYYGNLHYEYAYMIGWWLTDAWKQKDANGVFFCQSKPRTLLKLRNELDRLASLGKCKYSVYEDKREHPNHNKSYSFYVRGELAEHLLTNFPDREFKQEFIELDKSSKELLLEGLMDGDGSYRGDEYSRVFWSKKESRNDILSAMLTTMGYRNYISYVDGHCGVVFNIAHSTTELQYKHKKPNQRYVGKVYCLRTETGAFVVRRNGKPFISGNSGFPKSLNIGLAIDKKNGIDNRTGNLIKGQGVKDNSKNVMHLNCNEQYEERIAQNEWNGWGTQLKPAYEAIILARKPVESTVVDNVLKYGVGGLNIDECRVPFQQGEYDIRHYTKEDCFQNLTPKKSHFQVKPQPEGRFPANIILTYNDDDFDEVCGGFPNTEGGAFPKKINGKSNITFRGDEERENRIELNDSGSASRYFYCAKASSLDRNEGLVDSRNIHSTVKPVELMEYLVKLVTPKNGTILDPFNGSGSTGKAVMWQNKTRDANYKYIGIELNEEYLAISKSRIEYISNNTMDFILNAREQSETEKTKIEKEKDKYIDLFGGIDDE